MMRTVNAFMVTAAAASLATVLTAAPAPAPQADRPNAVPAVPATKAGWWIRVNPANQADNVSWRFGPVRNKLGNPLRWWKNEQPLEFDLPEPLRALPEVHLAAIGLPYKAPVSFCVFFADQGAALIEFDGEHAAHVTQAQRNPACVP